MNYILFFLVILILIKSFMDKENCKKNCKKNCKNNNSKSCC